VSAADWTSLESSFNHCKKAVASNDAGIPVPLWDMQRASKLLPSSRAQLDALPEEVKTRAFNVFREFGLCIFRRSLYMDCLLYLEKEISTNWREMDRR
jgi:hypothetical protein